AYRMATIIERMNKKTNLPSYRVQIRHHGRYLKRTGTNKSLSKTFHTKREAELYAASLEQNFREKRQKSKELDRMFREGIYVGQKSYDIMADLQNPAKPSEVLFAQVI